MPSSPRVALVVLAASALAVNATLSLAVKTSAPNVEVDGLQNLEVTVTVSNTGSETLKLLNDPRGVLSSFPEHSFNIANANGSRPSFNGAKVYFSPTYAAGVGDPSGFTVLAPGTSTNVSHDLSTAYNFTRSGAGDYSIEPSNLFTYVDGDGALKDLYATVEDVAKVKLSGILAVSRHVYDKRNLPRFQHCSWDEARDITSAAMGADDYAEDSYNHIERLWTGSVRYLTWFGFLTEPRRATALDHFRKIRGRPTVNFTYVCTDRDPTWFAWVYPDTFGVIYICKAFWALPENGTLSKAGTLIHESSHFIDNGGTLDYVGSKEDCQRLARRDPDLAIMNAESHRYFAENDPYKS